MSKEKQTVKKYNEKIKKWYKYLGKSNKQKLWATGVVLVFLLIIGVTASNKQANNSGSSSVGEKVTKTVTEEIQFETVYKDDGSMKVGEYKTINEGENGSKEVKYNVEVIDGKETNKQIVSETIIKQPVSRQILSGTKDDIVSYLNKTGEKYSFKLDLFIAGDSRSPEAFTKDKIEVVAWENNELENSYSGCGTRKIGAFDFMKELYGGEFKNQISFIQVYESSYFQAGLGEKQTPSNWSVLNQITFFETLEDINSNPGSSNLPQSAFVDYEENCK